MRRYEALIKYISCQPVKPYGEVICMLERGDPINLSVGTLLGQFKYCIVNNEHGHTYTVLHDYLSKIIGAGVVQELEELK